MKFQNNGNKSKIVKNVFWAVLGKVTNMLGVLLVGILVARYLGPEKYGVMNYVISYVSIFTIISTFGLSNIEVRELSKQTVQKDIILGTCFRLRLFFASIGYLCIVASLFIFKTDMSTSLMILLYALTLYTGSFEVIRNYFTSIVNNEYVVKSEITRTILGAMIKVVLLWFKAPLWAFVAATAFDTVLVASGYCISYSNKVDSIWKWTFDKSIVPYFLKQSFPLVLSGAAVVIYQRIDQVMIGNMIDKESVGYFATAGRFLDLILFLPHVLAQTVTPYIVKARSNGTIVEYRKKAEQFLGIVVWTAILLASLVSVLAYWLILYTYGKEYLAAVPVLQIMAFKTVGMALSSSGGQLMIIEGIQKWAVIKNIIGCFVCIILNLILIPEYGVVGSAWVTIITLSITGCLGNIVIPPYHNILKMELKAVFLGWMHLSYFKSFFTRKVKL